MGQNLFGILAKQHFPKDPTKINIKFFQLYEFLDFFPAFILITTLYFVSHHRSLLSYSASPNSTKKANALGSKTPSLSPRDTLFSPNTANTGSSSSLRRSSWCSFPPLIQR